MAFGDRSAPGGLTFLPERRPFGQVVLVLRDPGPLPFKEFLDRTAKAGMNNIMG